MTMNESTNMTTVTKYSALARIFHWGGALLIVAAWAVMEFDGLTGTISALNVHKMIGLAFLIWTVLRLGNIFVSKRPPMLPMPRWQTLIMHGVHVGLYVCMFAMPILGILTEQSSGVSVSFFGLFDLPSLIGQNMQLSRTFENLHKDVVFTALLLLIAAHVGGALYHQFIMKDNLIARMR